MRTGILVFLMAFVLDGSALAKGIAPSDGGGSGGGGGGGGGNCFKEKNNESDEEKGSIGNEEGVMIVDASGDVQCATKNTATGAVTPLRVGE